MNTFFKGWYFKCNMDNTTIALIPAFHSDGKQTSASLQIVMEERSYFLPYERLVFDKETNTVFLGNNSFSPKELRLSVNTDEVCAEGVLRFSKHQRLSRDVMGPFQYVPFMQCRHKVYSMHHFVNGRISINQQVYSFLNGNGYLEGDRGRSFPSKYLWTHCHFPQCNGSLMLSAADIPMGKSSFVGILAMIIIEGKEYRLTTYTGARLLHLSKSSISIGQGCYRLTARLLDNKRPLLLNAPDLGSMSRFIRESPLCTAYYHFSKGKKVILHEKSHIASFEYENPSSSTFQ